MTDSISEIVSHLVRQLYRMAGSYIDSDTKITTKVRRTDGKLLALVMSDEFKEPNRGFGPGEDEIFEALDKPDDSNESIVFCKSTNTY